MISTVLVTGGFGFIGSHFIRRLLREDGIEKIINLDCLTYAGREKRLVDLKADPRLASRVADVTDVEAVKKIFRDFTVHAVVHFAAETHVDRSIENAQDFLRTNVLGTHILLEEVRQHPAVRFLQISTDEVYGSLGKSGVFYEGDALQPKNPYAVSKAAGDLLGLSYHHTYGLDFSVVRSVNNYGPWQHPEKFLAKVIAAALENKAFPVYGDGSHVRSWIFVEDCCEAIFQILKRGGKGKIYHITSEEERTNRELASAVLKLLGKPETLMTFGYDRPGHDFRYALDPGSLKRELQWVPKESLSKALEKQLLGLRNIQGIDEIVKRVSSDATRLVFPNFRAV